MSDNYVSDSLYLEPASNTAVEVWCGIPALGELVYREINMQQLFLPRATSIKLIMDLPQGFALYTLERLRPSYRSNEHVMVITFSTCAEYWEDLWDLHPASLFVTTNHNFDLANSIRRVARGERCRITPDRATVLNQSERQLLRYMARGFSNKVMAQQLGLQEKTIMNNLTIIYNKLNVRCRTQAILHYWALQFEWGGASKSAAHAVQASQSFEASAKGVSRDIYPANTGHFSAIND